MMGKTLFTRELDTELRSIEKKDPSLKRFAYTVPRLKDLGKPLDAALSAHLEPGEIPQKVVVMPRQRLMKPVSKQGGRLPFLVWEQTPEIILLQTNQRLLKADLIQGGDLEVTSTPLYCILTFQIGKILLFSWFEWSWANEGKLETCRVYFNAVSEHIFRDLQQCLSAVLVQSGGMKKGQKSRGFEQPEDLPYKFRNIIPLRLLMPAEEIQAVIYRPGCWDPFLVFLKRHTLPAAVLVLTDGQIILAEEELGRSDEHYGVIARYMPRHKLQHATLEERKEGVLLHLFFQDQGAGYELELPFPLSAKPQLERLDTLRSIR